jgi:peroxiredoxin (alkyl hydroperoxide reductase subunit C)
MLTIGDRFPAFRLKGVVANDVPLDVTRAFQDFDERSAEGKWQVFFFYPKDFTFVCPTEIAGFARLDGEFRERDAQVYAVSTDSEFVHLAWRKDHESLRDLPFPMLSDLRRDLSEALGILERAEKVALRATFVVDPQGIIRFVSVTDGSVGRNPEEVLRVLDALQTGELCPCGWKPGQATLKVA